MRALPFVLVAGCAATATPAPRDAMTSPDRDVVIRDGEVDAVDPTDSLPVRDSGEDAADASADALVDAGVDRDVVALPPRPVGSSCAADGGAPPEHCREVRLGGPLEFVMGSTQASMLLTEQATRQMPLPNFRVLPMRACDLRRVRLRPGWIDAHEVSVARFRAWLQAGRPMPRNNGGPGVPLTHVWGDRATEEASARVGFSSPPEKDIVNNTTFRGAELPLEASRCTWTEMPGPNEDRPMTCVSSSMARAFCSWDGRHLVTSAAREYVARAAGATETVTGAVPSPDVTCDLEGVGLMPTLGASRCPPPALPWPIGTHRRALSAEPTPGVADLVGNVSEFAFTSGLTRGTIGMCPQNASLRNEGTYEVGTSVLGLNYYTLDVEVPSLVHPGSRVNFGDGVRSPRVGFRCARWVDEPP